MTESDCKGCGKTIRWVRNEASKWVPLDPRPPVYKIDEDFAGEPVARLVGDHEYMVSHFSTCPKANDFSSSRK